MTLPRAKDYTGPRSLVLDVSHWQGEIGRASCRERVYGTV